VESQFTTSAHASIVPTHGSKSSRFNLYSQPQPAEPDHTSTVSPTTSSLHSSSTRSEGKSKLNFSDDDIPLALLKKTRYESLESTGSLYSLKMVALSLTKLQDSPFPRGPIQAFWASPLYGNHGKKWEALP
jgi:hypothetical protein